ncbi:hypothetical protein [Haloarchaeobius sp. TZWWS8]|uniref:hypothetical protein n=1 Tax=Haloarchaeobius sp. TZWWS8 TaxID=3446121 RepID=UPI003EBB0851
MVNPVGALLVLAGLPLALRPYRIARLSERLDSLGSKTHWGDVEPANWKVLLTRVVGVGAAIVDVMGLVGV